MAKPYTDHLGNPLWTEREFYVWARKETCPKCGAKDGAECIKANGETSRRLHYQRTNVTMARIAADFAKRDD